MTGVQTCALPIWVWLRLYNAEGASAAVPFLIGQLPEVAEQEPNNTLQNAQSIAMPQVTINGALAAAKAAKRNPREIAGLIADMKTHPEWIETGLSLFSAVRHLERIADHATNIAEDVIYLVEGAVVRHHPEAV